MDGIEPLRLGEIEIHWLKGGDFRLDGGTMFGAVPKALWQKKYAAGADNCIQMCNDPLLVKTPDRNILIDTGLGNRLTDKQTRIFQVSSAWNVPAHLEQLGLHREDVDMVVLTHCDFDHAGGIEMVNAAGHLELTFPRAVHLVQEAEWWDVEHPNDRSKATYIPQNFQLLKQLGRLQLINGEMEICRGITIRHTGGHTRGHQMIEIHSQGETAVHLGDLCPTHAHTNPLWVMAYDNFPLDAIARKKTFFQHYSDQNCWFTLYHDPWVRAMRLDAEGNIQDSWPEAASSDGDLVR